MCAATTASTAAAGIAGAATPADTPDTPSTTGAPTATVPWEELVSSALLGTDRRPLRPGPDATRSPTGGRSAPASSGASIPGSAGGPAALLEAAALHTVRRRAALLPATGAARPVPAPPDPRRPLPAAARRRLAQLLTDRSAPSGGGRRGSAPDLTELIPQWLAMAGERGFRAPAELLPALLDAARARTDLRPHVLAFAGPRGLWLAALNPDWRFALRASAGAHRTAAESPEELRRLWEEGLFAERVALLGTVRARDPEAARALLAGTWPGERAEDRLMFLDSLRVGLEDADEPFLEQALSDRSRNVRSTAAELLSALPESALARRMAARATTCVNPDRTGDGLAIAVEAPHECDADMQRDGLTPVPPSGRGERSWWLGQLVESAPLAIWRERFGGRTAQEIVGLPVADGWEAELHAAWCRAAVRQRDSVWSRALLGSPSTPPANGPGTSSLAERSQLLATLPSAERADWVAGFIAAHGLSEAFQLLGVCTVPWTGPLGRSVVDALDIARDAGSYPWSFSGVMGLAERCLDPAEADRLEILTTLQDESEDASPGAGGYWSEAFRRLVSTLRLRAAMDAELGEPPAPGCTSPARAASDPRGTDSAAGTAPTPGVPAERDT
ncbi:DUF5691 domain-containing protein [Streptomyces sp. NBC_01754]|uniref:DUF5691 domain-containing protein n=1 Tax=Streptomyces sp. NBC_01754 TaxID=2975930 RepID=UPI002DD9B2C7|nr:DUF5691 domain-containing protein [Streptomyces sp. NBC_01754]WSC94398.1 DUF5691 domain-containing protein [Streptomyces sp. NBC_01754]